MIMDGIPTTTDRKTVLLVDDNESFRYTLAKALEHAGNSVTAVANVSEGIRVGTERQFDTALIDLSLPDGSGREVALAIRGQARQIIGISGYPDRHSEFDDHLVKPIALDTILEVLRNQ